MIPIMVSTIAVITTAGDLPAKYVIHTVGPIYGRHNGQEPELLAACYRNSIHLALGNGLDSIAFPSISTGPFPDNTMRNRSGSGRSRCCCGIRGG